VCVVAIRANTLLLLLSSGGKEDFELIKDESDRDGWKLAHCCYCLHGAFAQRKTNRTQSAPILLTQAHPHIERNTCIKEHFAKTIKCRSEIYLSIPLCTLDVVYILIVLENAK
jgi:hypothetical protein